MGRVVGGAARGTVDHGGRGHRVACVVLAGRDAGRRSGHRGQGELLLTRMRGSISRGDEHRRGVRVSPKAGGSSLVLV